MTYIDFTLKETRTLGVSHIEVKIVRVRMDGIFRFHVYYKGYTDDTWTLFTSSFALTHSIEVTTAGAYQVRVQTEELAPRRLESFDTAPAKLIQVTLTSDSTYTGTFQTSDPTTGDYAILDESDDTIRTYRSSAIKTELSDMAYSDQLRALTAAGLTLAEDGGAVGVFIQDSTAYVGIGHSDPTARLHVKSTSDAIGIIEQVSADATGTFLEMIKRRGATAAGQANDDIGTILFTSHDSDTPALEVDYASILGEIADPTAGSEEGKITLYVMDGGVLTAIANVTSDGLEMLSGDIALPALATVDGIDVSVHAANTTTLHPDPAGQTDKYLKSNGTVYTWASSSVSAHDVDGADHNAPTPGGSEDLVFWAENDGMGGTTLEWVTAGTAFNKSFGTAADSVCQGNDARLTDARTPTAHASSHESSGADKIDALSLYAADGIGDDFLALSSGASPPFTVVSSGYNYDSFAAAAHNHSGVYAPISHVGSTGAEHGNASGTTGGNVAGFATPAMVDDITAANSHRSNTSNPHSVTYSQVGAAATSHGIHLPSLTVYDADKVARVNAGSYAYELVELTYSDVGAAAGSGYTANMAAVTNAGGQLTASSTISVTELGYLNGVSSNIQDQLNGKSATTHTQSTTYGGLGTNVSAYSGLLLMQSGTTPTTVSDNSSNWNTAYSDRLKWDGGATGLTAATGRTSLELGTAATKDVGTGSGDVAAGNHVQTVANGGTGNDNSGIASDRLVYFDSGTTKIIGLTPGTAIADKSAYSTSPTDIGEAARMVDLNDLKDALNTILARLRSAYVIAT
jgi:hypothetical protein